ncbi:hypothetical protein Asera_51140 [Actinocatenispora sera]|uniref:Uncharacterized protein n=1 Tax=Actinocatenispora sera TaxID=390989 RepID=A0A810L9N7_9ACTN|nr:hypothetical protein Asera_51140 [Actinocatenispora sera]
MRHVTRRTGARAGIFAAFRAILQVRPLASRKPRAPSKKGPARAFEEEAMVLTALLVEAVAAVLVAGALAMWSRRHFAPRTVAANRHDHEL